MTIVKRPLGKSETASAQKFIDAAPDGAGGGHSGADEGVQITLRMNKDQLERLTAIAKRQGIARASYIKRAVFIQLEADEKT